MKMRTKVTGQILQELRNLMAERSMNKGIKLNALMVSCKDDHMNREVVEADARLAYVSGFTGTFGTGVITQKEAHLWTDSRFEEQAKTEVDENWTVKHAGAVHNYMDWMRDYLPAGSKVGVDPKTLSYQRCYKMEKTFRNHSISLDPLSHNFVDIVWKNRPKKIFKPIFVQPHEYTGKTILEKLTEVWDQMKKLPASILLVTMLSDVAWTLNLRGSDVPLSPLFFAYLLILDKTFILFTDPDVITPEIKAHLDREMNLPYSIQPYCSIYKTLQTLSTSLPDFTWASKYTSYATASIVPRSKLYLDFIPITAQKLIKTDNEIKGMWASNIRDSAAACCVLEWLDTNIKHRAITEYEVVEKLEEFRHEQDLYIGPGKPTISSSGKNTIMKHYYPTETQYSLISQQEVYLLSIGGHYRDGSACLTRMMHFGQPNEVEQNAFTKVLKGIIGMSLALFPNKCKGTAIDVLARKFLWESGIDYDYRTGHAVGSFLKLHDEAMEINKVSERFHPDIEARMFFTVEPVYTLNEYAMYMMNVVHTVYADSKGISNFLKLDTITFCPIQKRMIALDLITTRELTWINNYHKTCQATLIPLLDSLGKKEVITWLLSNTEEIQSHEAIYAS